MGTWDKDEATLECFALVSIAKDFNNFDNKRGNIHKSVFPIVVPQVFFYRGPATADEDSVCVTEFFTNPTITFTPFVRDVVRTQKMLYETMQGLLDMLLLLKQNAVQHNDIHGLNILILQDYNTATAAPDFAFALVDFSYSICPPIISAPLVNDFKNLLQSSGLDNVPPDGPLCDVYSTGIIISTMVSRFTFGSSHWAYPVVDLMLDRRNSPDWTWQSISVLKDKLHNDFVGHCIENDMCVEPLKFFPNREILGRLNEYRQYLSCGNGATESCESTELAVLDNDHTLAVRLGSLQMSLDLNQEGDGVALPLVALSGHDALRWGFVKLVFDDLLSLWDHFDVTVIDVGGGGGHSFVCLHCYLYYNTSCTVFDTTGNRYGIMMKAALEHFPSLPLNPNPLYHRDISQSLDYPFEADIITVLGNSLWMHYCVEGNLGHVVKKFASRARAMLIVEWVDPADDDIAKLREAFPHCAHPTISADSAAYSPYTLVEFKRVSQTDFCGMTSFNVGQVSETRTIIMNIHIVNDTFSHLIGKNTANASTFANSAAVSVHDIEKQIRLMQFYNQLRIYS
jgi:serine/threonine protein kinase